MIERKIALDGNASAVFNNNVDFCVGTGRMGLALQKEYMKQLQLVQSEIGFKHIRGHGLFCDDMAIYQEREYDGEVVVEYNFTYLDLVMDSYIEVGLKPFLELGFMPYKLARGTQTVFYWKGNTTPPKDYEMWADLIKATLTHLCDRYGRDEVVTWPVEVWNEPNLRGFWENADMEEYYKLFSVSFEAVKSVDKRFRVGGPAVCGGTDEIWISGFMEYCHKNSIPIDFVTRHHYTSELPEDVGHYGYIELMKPEDGFDNLHTTREIIDKYPEYKGLEIHITEYNTSYIPNAPIHDTNQNAAAIAHQLSRLGDDNESYSYWTFGDIFEERGVPFTPFHGGFGMVANGCIPKPTFYSFAFYKALKEKEGKCIYKDDNAVIIKTADGYRGVLWNHSLNRCGEALKLDVEFETEKGEYSLLTKLVDEKTCNPLKAWHDLGEPANPSAAELKIIKSAAVPFIQTDRMSVDGDKKTITFELDEYGLMYFEFKKIIPQNDRGYSYERAVRLDK